MVSGEKKKMKKGRAKDVGPNPGNHELAAGRKKKSAAQRADVCVGIPDGRFQGQAKERGKKQGAGGSAEHRNNNKMGLERQ